MKIKNEINSFSRLEELTVEQIIDYVVKIELVESLNNNIDFTKKTFTEINRFYANDATEKSNGIKKYYNLMELETKINEFQNPTDDKNDNLSLLKGIYDGGTRGINCIETSPYLFFDIDVSKGNNEKKGKNEILFNPALNIQLFDYLSQRALITFRSHSKLGIAGILYVPKLIEFDHLSREIHSIVGNEINLFLSQRIKDDLGLEIEFDNAQNKFRQIRNIAEQNDEEVKLNLSPWEFSYEIEEKPKRDSLGIPQFVHTDRTSVKGSIKEQFNKSNNILDIALANGFSEISFSNSEIRVKHQLSVNKSSGVIDTSKNLYFNYSDTFKSSVKSKTSRGKVFDPFNMALECEYDGNYGKFMEFLKSKGYENEVPSREEFERAAKYLQGNPCDKLKFKVCYDLQYGSMENKLWLVDQVCQDSNIRKTYCSYLKLNDLRIKYDYNFEIENHFSEKFSQILDCADDHGKVLVYAETGAGKTTAIIKDFETLRPGKRVLILEPLTSIVEQFGSKNNKIVNLIGGASTSSYRNAMTENVVIATYEQGIKLLNAGIEFDYYFIDEVHNLLTAIPYKEEVIIELTKLLTDKMIIGLTGTPTNIFKKLGFKFIQVQKKISHPVKIEQRVYKVSPDKVILKHLESVKGKALIRINSKVTINILKKHLTENNFFTEKEMLILHADDKIKKSASYTELLKKEKFPDEVKLIFTTSLIDEGISIRQEEFSDVIFIETKNLRPENVKQFFARFRNDDPNRKNIYYSKLRRGQTWTVTDEDNYFDKKLTSSINPILLAYEASNNTFSNMSNEEFNSYIEYNYNVSFTIKEWSENDYSFSGLKTTKETINEEIAACWLANTTLCLNSIQIRTENKNIKKTIKHRKAEANMEVSNFIKTYYNKFEGIAESFTELKLLGLKPNEHIFCNGDLKSTRTLNSEIRMIKVLRISEEPLTKWKERKIKLINQFFTEIVLMKYFQIKDLPKHWKLTGELKLTKTQLFELLKEKHKITKDKDRIYTIH